MSVIKVAAKQSTSQKAVKFVQSKSEYFIEFTNANNTFSSLSHVSKISNSQFFISKAAAAKRKSVPQQFSDAQDSDSDFEEGTFQQKRAKLIGNLLKFICTLIVSFFMLYIEMVTFLT